MDALLILVPAAFGLYMAWNIGANDVANSMADAVGSRAMKIRSAIVAAGICEFAGAVLVGSHVTDTVRKGIVDPAAMAASAGVTEVQAAAIVAIGMTAALLAAGLWLNLASWVGVPVSTTHSIVGSIVGFGIVAGGFHIVNWPKMGQIVASWFVSPAAGGVMAYIFFKLISKTILDNPRPVRAARNGAPVVIFFVFAIVTLATLYKGLKHILAHSEWMNPERALIAAAVMGLVAGLVSRLLLGRNLADKEALTHEKQLRAVERIFAPVVVVTSCSVAFAHGANDVANSVGPLAAVAHIVEKGTLVMKVPVPLWILVLGGAGIVVGLATYGYRVIYTVGRKITHITPSRGVAADVAAMATVLAATRLKLPISTTHTLVGSIFGIGMARGISAINLRTARNIIGSWLLTVPAAALLAALFYVIGKALLFEQVVNAIGGVLGTG